ncbi:RDD family protein [Acinetobacter sp. B5B]|uniref:RDD family protein n=1 Tax=Acinetobacter baretiae TaxID=2605383 RepID=UPI0018C31D43|nr:RDD family protein [Acinetobacter baretiae]MBF7682761.1 RDD family protein [Acinetobacter baretiae]
MQIYLARNSQQAGPYSLEQLNQMLQDQQILLTDLVWHQGMTEWKTLGELTRGQLQYLPQGYQYNHENEPIQTKQSTHTTLELASISSRAVAKIVDMLILLSALIVPSFFISEENAKQIESLGNGFSTAAQEQLIQLIPSQAWFAMFIYVIIVLAIQAFLLNKYGQSLGKMITKIKIIDQKTDEKVPLTRIFLIRSVFFIVFNLLSSPLMSIIDYAFALGKNRQALHDRLAKTKVIRMNKN